MNNIINLYLIMDNNMTILKSLQSQPLTSCLSPKRNNDKVRCFPSNEHKTQLDFINVFDNKMDFDKKEINRETLLKIENEIENIKNKLKTLNDTSQINKNKTILELILPKELVMIKKMNYAKNQQIMKEVKEINHLNPRSKLYKETTKSMYDKTKEVVKKLNLYENEKDFEKQNQRNTIANNKDFIHQMSFIPKVSGRNESVNPSNNNHIKIEDSKIKIKSVFDPSTKQIFKSGYIISNKPITGNLNNLSNNLSQSKQGSNKQLMFDSTFNKQTNFRTIDEYEKSELNKTNETFERFKTETFKIPEKSNSRIKFKLPISTNKSLNNISNTNKLKSRNNITSLNTQSIDDKANKSLNNSSNFDQVSKSSISDNVNNKKASDIKKLVILPRVTQNLLKAQLTITTKNITANLLNESKPKTSRVIGNKINSDKELIEKQTNFNTIDYKKKDDEELELLTIHEQFKATQGNELIEKSNIQKEEKQEIKLKKLNESLAQMNEKYNRLSENLERVNKRLIEISTEKDSLSALIKAEDKIFKDKLLKSIKKSTKKEDANNEDKEKENIEYERIKFIEKIEKMQIREQTLKREVNMAKYIKESLLMDIHLTEETIGKYKKNIKLVIQRLENHYYDLLLEGKDTRSTGITWLMLSIWKLGSEVYMSYMPKFLDNKLIEYFFLRSHKEIELLRARKLLNELRELVRIFRGKEYRKQKIMKKLSFEKNDIIDFIHNFRLNSNIRKLKENIDNQSVNDEQRYLGLLKKKSSKRIKLKSFKFKIKSLDSKENEVIKKSVFSPLPDIANKYTLHYEQDELNFNEIKNYFTKKDENELDYDTKMLISYVEDLESISKQIESDINIMKNKEMERIVKEFLINDYERTHRVNIDVIFSTLVGQRQVYDLMKYYLDEKKNYYKSLELCKNYNKFQNKYEMIYSNLFTKDK